MPRGSKGDYDLSDEFRELCYACRTGDSELVDKYIASGINLNQMDEWDYSPLILASVCGHEGIVKMLLEKGCVVNRDTFEGARAIYGALNDQIRTLLLSYDITKAVEATQPFASHISSMVTKPKFVTADLLFELDETHNMPVHRFMLAAMSDYFGENLRTLLAGSRYSVNPGLLEGEVARFQAKSWQFVLDYIYLLPKLELAKVDLSDLVKLARFVGLPDLASAAERIHKQETMAEKSKVKNEVRRQMCEIARGKLKRFVAETIIDAKLEFEDGEDAEENLTEEAKADLIKANGADLIMHASLEDGRQIYYPVHRAIMARSEYFDTLFQSSFADTSVFNDLELENLRIIDREELLEDAGTIPVVTLPIAIKDEQLLVILLSFLYYDSVEIPDALAIDTLVLADSLFIDRLKTLAAIAITTIRDYDEENISIYDILRVAWQTRVQRLETHVAKIISDDLSRYFRDPQFKEIVRESAERIELREQYDTIELIDDIKFYLGRRYHIDNEEEGTLDPDLKVIVDENYQHRVDLYEADLTQLDDIVESIGMKRWVEETIE